MFEKIYKFNILFSIMSEFAQYSSWILWKSKVKEKSLTDTLKETLNLFNQGMNVFQIAKERSLKKESIEKHLIDLIARSQLWVGDVVGEKKFKFIFKRLEEQDLDSLSYLYEEVLDKRCSYFEIKCVLAYLASLPNRR